MDVEQVASTLVIVLVSGFAVVGLIAVVLVIIVAVRYRRALPGALAVLGAVLYGASPIDFLPEAFVGPIGVLDDVGILGAAVAFLVYQLRKRRGGDDDIQVEQLD